MSPFEPDAKVGSLDQREKRAKLLQLFKKMVLVGW
jgi:hypothetical protein